MHITVGAASSFESDGRQDLRGPIGRWVGVGIVDGRPAICGVAGRPGHGDCHRPGPWSTTANECHGSHSLCPYAACRAANPRPVPLLKFLWRFREVPFVPRSVICGSDRCPTTWPVLWAIGFGRRWADRRGRQLAGIATPAAQTVELGEALAVLLAAGVLLRLGDVVERGDGGGEAADFVSDAALDEFAVGVPASAVRDTIDVGGSALSHRGRERRDRRRGGTRRRGRRVSPGSGRDRSAGRGQPARRVTASRRALISWRKAITLSGVSSRRPSRVIGTSSSVGGRSPANSRALST